MFDGKKQFIDDLCMIVSNLSYIIIFIYLFNVGKNKCKVPLNVKNACSMLIGAYRSIKCEY